MIPIATFSSPGRKRQMVLVPEINPHSFQFFFEKGATGYSYSLRDYSVPNHVKERYARDIGWTADQVRQKAAYICPAPYLDVRRLDEWHAYTIEINRRHGLAEEVNARAAISVGAAKPVISLGRFPLLNSTDFVGLPKAAKTCDVRRMLDSDRSEDWVTWNLINLVQMTRPDSWWSELCAQVRGANLNADLSLTEIAPQVRFWPTVPSPKQYEARSRERMRMSLQAMTVARTLVPTPVEGDSEIDLAFQSPSFLIYVEAKLYSDISMRTTHDLNRNQIVRNIDCLLDSAHGRTPFFWMFVRDLSPAKIYTQLMEEYRQHPQSLIRELPHREPEILKKIAERLVILSWREIAKEACEVSSGDDELLRLVKREILRRIC